MPSAACDETCASLARLSPGQRVLDGATRTGFAAEVARNAVGRFGEMTAVDDAPNRRQSAREGGIVAQAVGSMSALLASSGWRHAGPREESWLR